MNVYFKETDTDPEKLIIENVTITELQILKAEFESGEVCHDLWSDTIQSVTLKYGIDEDGDLYALFTAGV